MYLRYLSIISFLNLTLFQFTMVKLYKKQHIDQRTGSGLFASQRISSSTNIIKTNHILTALDQQTCKSHCNHCLKESFPLRRCSKCKQVRYCSEKCQKEGWLIHKLECAYLGAVPATSAVPPLIRMCALILSSTEVRNYCSVDSLMNHDAIESEKAREYYPFVMKGVTDLLKKSCTVEPSEVYSIYSKLIVNLFTLEDGQLRAIGSTLIPELSKINHSCDPNCVLSFKGRSAYITAIKDIQKGSEITISYIPLPKPFLSRKEQLITQFSFTCFCTLCTRQREEGTDAMLLRECPVCEEYAHPSIDFEKDDLQCPSCQSSLRKSLKMNDLVMKNIASFDSAISTRAPQDVEIINHLIDETESLILDKRWEPALRTGLKAIVGLMDWAQNYPSTGLFLAKLGKLYLEQESTSKAEQMDNINNAVQMFDISLKCLSLALSRHHELFVEVENLYRSTQDVLRARNDI